MRERIGIGLMLILLALSIGATWIMTDWNAPAAQALEQAADHARGGNWETAERVLLDAKEQWENHWHITAVFADHGPMEEIDGLFAQLEVYVQARDPVVFAAACRDLRQRIQDMVEAHRLTWWNLL